MKVLLYLSTILFICSFAPAQLETQKFYDYLQTEESFDFSEVGTLLDLKSSTGRARWGALQMKASKFEMTPLQKLEKFKAGKNALEKETAAPPPNGEFRFLRLVIQEHVPVFLQYSANIEEDAEAITVHYSEIDKTIRPIILKYAHKSMALKVEKLN